MNASEEIPLTHGTHSVEYSDNESNIKFVDNFDGNSDTYNVDSISSKGISQNDENNSQYFLDNINDKSTFDSNIGNTTDAFETKKVLWKLEQLSQNSSLQMKILF